MLTKEELAHISDVNIRKKWGHADSAVAHCAQLLTHIDELEAKIASRDAAIKKYVIGSRPAASNFEFYDAGWKLKDYARAEGIIKDKDAALTLILESSPDHPAIYKEGKRLVAGKSYSSGAGPTCPHGHPDGVGCLICDTDGASEAQGTIFKEGE